MSNTKLQNYLCYDEMKHADWIEKATGHGIDNQNALFQYSVLKVSKICIWNLLLCMHFQEIKITAHVCKGIPIHNRHAT